jgi:hypothetical protein
MITIQVKLLVPICGPEGTFQAGDVVFLSEHLSSALVRAGQAELVGVVPVEIIPEVKVEPEVVIVTKNKKDKSFRKERK